MVFAFRIRFLAKQNTNDDSLVVNLNEDGQSYGMKYERLVPILVNAIKELSAKVTALEAG